MMGLNIPIVPTKRKINSMHMWTVDQVVDNTLKELRLPESEIKQLSSSEANSVVANAMDKFVIGTPRVWWLSLKRPCTSIDVSSYDNLAFLSDYIPEEVDRCYFIPENEGALRVFDATLPAICRVLEESSFFEYYLLDKSYKWLMIENDHNELIICGAM